MTRKTRKAWRAQNQQITEKFPQPDRAGHAHLYECRSGADYRRGARGHVLDDEQQLGKFAGAEQRQALPGQRRTTKYGRAAARRGLEHHSQFRQPDHCRGSGRSGASELAIQTPVGESGGISTSSSASRKGHRLYPSPRAWRSRGWDAKRQRRSTDWMIFAARRRRWAITASSSQLNVIAFSDPNDILSYPVQDDFARNTLDSRLCAQLVNVSLNVAQEKDLLGAVTLGRPLGAHSGYLPTGASPA